VTWRAVARSVTALAVAYALVFQVFAAAIGLPLASAAVPGAALELCAHASQDAPVLPGDAPSAPCIQHCVLCFVSNISLAPPDALAFRAAEFATAKMRWYADGSRRPEPLRHSSARPRGPPISA
jgi:hypothetical protein